MLRYVAQHTKRIYTTFAMHLDTLHTAARMHARNVNSAERRFARAEPFGGALQIWRETRAVSIP
jgi:hypothetical protein